jgi:hypothetical protein
LASTNFRAISGNRHLTVRNHTENLVLLVDPSSKVFFKEVALPRTFCLIQQTFPQRKAHNLIQSASKYCFLPENFRVQIKISNERNSSNSLNPKEIKLYVRCCILHKAFS